ncbi:unnamed protein product [Linum tenue]|uniref:Transmembrane protein n=1 Tax=Linum tenue TaxID=586396 RepID=A0AAV0K5Q0_9ROSI|nr:unnamed protein product [Linum tenue]
MHRSSSTSRFSDEDRPSYSIPKSKSTTFHDLPTYDPLSHVAKKEISRLRSAENAVHFIPLVLLLSAIVLWFFSSTGYKLSPNLEFEKLNFAVPAYKLASAIPWRLTSDLRDFELQCYPRSLPLNM